VSYHGTFFCADNKDTSQTLEMSSKVRPDDPEVTGSGPSLGDYSVLIKKYNRLKEEIHNVFWKHSIKNDPQLSSIPPETSTPINDKNFEYKLEECLGTGQYGTVYRAKKEGATYAVKNVDKKKIRTYQQLIRLATEIEIVRKLDHPNIIVLHDVINTPTSLLICFSLGDCDVFELTSSNNIPPRSLRIMTEQLMSAVSYLDRMNVAHRDIKPENIICSYKEDLIRGKIDTNLNRMYIKLVDFGLAVKYSNLPYIVGTSYKLREFCGSPGFFAPELLKNKGYNNRADWWSTGCVVLEFVIKNEKFSQNWMTLYTPQNIKNYEVFMENMSLRLPRIKQLIEKDPLRDDYLVGIVNSTLAIEPDSRSLY